MRKSTYNDWEKRMFVMEKIFNIRSDKEICHDAQITRSTLANWVDQFPEIEKYKRDVFNYLTETNQFKKIKAKYVANESLNKNNSIIVSALTKIDDNQFKAKLAKQISRNRSIKLWEACEMIGISIDDCKKPNLPKIDDGVILIELDKLLSDPNTSDKDKTFEKCYTIIKENLPQSEYYQLRQIWKTERNYLNKCKQNARNERRRIMIDTEGYEGANWALVSLKAHLKSSTNFKYTSKNYKPDINTLIFAVFEKNDYTPLTITFSPSKLSAYCINTFLEKSYEKLGKPGIIYCDELVQEFVHNWDLKNDIGSDFTRINNEELTLCREILKDNLRVTDMELNINGMKSNASSCFHVLEP